MKRCRAFISWSGTTRSHAEMLAEVFSASFPHVEVFLSTKGIDKGKKWFDTIMSELRRADFGVFCINDDNKNSIWLNFELGAILGREKPVLGLLCPPLPDNLKSPITHYQTTKLTNTNDVTSFFNAIEKATGGSRSEETIEQIVQYQVLPRIDASPPNEAAPSAKASVEADPNEILLMLKLWEAKKAGLESHEPHLLATYLQWEQPKVEYVARQAAKKELVRVFVEHGDTEIALTEQGEAVLYENELMS